MQLVTYYGVSGEGFGSCHWVFCAGMKGFRGGGGKDRLKTSQHGALSASRNRVRSSYRRSAWPIKSAILTSPCCHGPIPGQCHTGTPAKNTPDFNHPRGAIRNCSKQVCDCLESSTIIITTATGIIYLKPLAVTLSNTIIASHYYLVRFNL